MTNACSQSNCNFRNILFVLQVSEMKAEYYPPKVEIILQNEIPTDFYILVSGEVVCLLSFSLKQSYIILDMKLEICFKLQDVLTYKNGTEQVCYHFLKPLCENNLSRDCLALYSI